MIIVTESIKNGVHVTIVGTSRAKVGQNLGSDVGIGGLVRIVGMCAERCISAAFRSTCSELVLSVLHLAHSLQFIFPVHSCSAFSVGRSRGATKATEVAFKDHSMLSLTLHDFFLSLSLQSFEPTALKVELHPKDLVFSSRENRA